MEPALRLDASIEELSEEEALRSLMEGDGVARDR
jgi:hypothetical protein